MSYSNFTLPAARTAFQLEEEDIAGLFSNIDPVTPSELLHVCVSTKSTVSNRYRYRKG